MDKLLKPDRLDIDSNSTNATQLWTHWKRTFQNFLEAANVSEDKDKLNLLVNYVNPVVYEAIGECTTYTDATATLEKLYIKQKSEIFARHTLSTRKQQVDESIDQYLLILKHLSKDCNFQAVSADRNKDDYIRDSFIRGLSASNIRQRLLESATLTLDQAYNSARALEMAQQQSDSYIMSNSIVNSITTDNTLQNTAHETDQNNSTSAATFSKCWFCGKSRHTRDRCPAKNHQCSCAIRPSPHSKTFLYLLSHP
uniref:Uncharacterized protein LOC114334978 n=1 Tax=Diabrotica virgifera virgifera TaxID=50390 RepID=A0A6P7FWU1_DIAVI